MAASIKPNHAHQRSNDPLDIEERRALLLLKAHYDITHERAAAVLGRIFANLKPELYGREGDLIERMTGNFDATVPLQEELFRRILHDNLDDQTAWNRELLDDIRYEVVPEVAEPHPENARPINLRPLPPCKQQYSLDSKLTSLGFESYHVLHLIKTKFDFHPNEAAALMQAMYHESPPCTRQVCDGYAKYLDLVHDHITKGQTVPQWKVPAEDLEETEKGVPWDRLQRKINDAAATIGVSITYLSIEPEEQEPRLLEMRRMSSRHGWAVYSPARKWEHLWDGRDEKEHWGPLRKRRARLEKEGRNRLFREMKRLQGGKGANWKDRKTGDETGDDEIVRDNNEDDDNIPAQVREAVAWRRHFWDPPRNDEDEESLSGRSTGSSTSADATPSNSGVEIIEGKRYGQPSLIAKIKFSASAAQKLRANLGKLHMEDGRDNAKTTVDRAVAHRTKQSPPNARGAKSGKRHAEAAEDEDHFVPERRPVRKAAKKAQEKWDERACFESKGT